LSYLAFLLMAMDEQRKAAFDYASDTTKQLITLATAIVGVSITFATDIVSNTTAHREILIIAWSVYVASIVLGVWSLLSMTGELEPKSGSATPSIRRANVVLPAILQILAFLIATVLLVVYAGVTLDEKATPSPASTPTTTTG